MGSQERDRGPIWCFLELISTGELKKETEGLIFAAQVQALRTNAIKSECVVVMKLCSIFCVVTPSLRRQNIKRDMMLLGRSYNWELCKQYRVECSDKWYEHSPKSVK